MLDSSWEDGIVETRAGDKGGNLWFGIRLFQCNQKQIRLVLEQKRIDMGRRGQAAILCC